MCIRLIMNLCFRRHIRTLMLTDLISVDKNKKLRKLAFDTNRAHCVIFKQ